MSGPIDSSNLSAATLEVSPSTATDEHGLEGDYGDDEEDEVGGVGMSWGMRLGSEEAASDDGGSGVGHDEDDAPGLGTEDVCGMDRGGGSESFGMLV